MPSHTESIMLPQSQPQPEDTKQISGHSLPHSPPMISVEVRERSPKNSSPKKWLGLEIEVIVVAGLLGSGIWSRVKARNALNAQTDQAALTAVSVVSPKQTAPADELVLPGNVQPFITSPIYARTNGYLKKWYFDIGAQ